MVITQIQRIAQKAGGNHPAPQIKEDLKMYQITEKQWNEIPEDYKGKWDYQPDIPETYIGKRTVFEGCIKSGCGTALITEGIHFEITKSKSARNQR